jgi:iron complex outermembrane receptor protein
MRNKLKSNIAPFVSKLLAVGFASATLLCVTMRAAETTNTTALPAVIVTGSMIPTAETVGPVPVDVVSADTIQKIGAQDVLATLQKLNPSFTGNGNAGQTVNNGGGGEAYVAIRNLPTLVLLDGRRLANSAFSSGALVDVNMIPLAMIERIEILKDGSSALYGSEAIGGVVNIITKKNFNGVEVGGRYGFATGKGTVGEEKAYIVGGTTTEKSSVTMGAQYYRMDPLLSADRKVASAGVTDMISKDIAPPSYVSPSFPGRVQSGGTSYILAGSPFAVGNPGYNPAITRPPSAANPNVGGIPYVPGVYSSVASYLTAHPGVYIPIANTPAGQQLIDAGVGGEANVWPLLNTTLLGTHSIQSQDRRNAFASASHQIFDKRMELFGSFLFGQTSSEGRLAPSPVSSLGLYKIFIPADSPVNPFGVALGDPDQGGASSPRVRTRFIDSGNRIFQYDNEFYRFVGGLKGAFDNGYTYEAAYNYNRNDQIAYTHNAINGTALDLATQISADPALAALGLSRLTLNGTAVPLYDPFALPGASSPATIDAMRTTLFQTGVSELWGVDGNITGTPFDLPAGKLAFAVGVSFYTESLSLNIDGLTKLGKVPGLNPQQPTPGGRRDAWAGFIEVRLPITSEEKNIPAFHSLEITAAGRIESFDPGGDSAVPKVGVRWQPLDKQLTLRGSYSQSFVAPTVFQLFGGAATSFDYVNFGDNQVQVPVSWVSNPGLKPADADNYSFGFVFSPEFVKGLTLSVDYYHIQTKGDVYRVGAQAIADDLNAFGSASQFASTFFFGDGTRLTTTAPNQVDGDNWGTVDRPYRNGSQQMTDGLDISATYELPTENYGKFTFVGAANVLFNYKYKDPEIGGYYQYADQFTDSGPAAGSQGTLPEFLLTLGMSWDIKDFTYSINSRYIPPVKDLGDTHPSVGSTSSGYTISGQTWEIEDYYTIDMQLAYEIGKSSESKHWYDGTRFAIGCNNITDSAAPFISSSTEDNTDKQTYDILGRFVYFEVSKKF